VPEEFNRLTALVLECHGDSCATVGPDVIAFINVDNSSLIAILRYKDIITIEFK
jgi:hypothetical protein